MVSNYDSVFCVRCLLNGCRSVKHISLHCLFPVYKIPTQPMLTISVRHYSNSFANLKKKGKVLVPNKEWVMSSCNEVTAECSRFTF
jgi:hypothetical protein